jgi:hypothetical protein
MDVLGLGNVEVSPYGCSEGCSEPDEGDLRSKVSLSRIRDVGNSKCTEARKACQN